VDNSPGKRARVLTSAVKVVLSAGYIAFVFTAAGTLRWPRFWFYIGLYVVMTGSLMLWLKKRNPGLFKERMTAAKKSDVKKWDRTIVGAYTVFLLIMYLVIPLDAVRFRWSRVPLALSWLAFAGLLGSWALVVFAFRVNSYLSGFVRIQSDRGQTVCTAGPYRFMRHPMYLANILACLCVPPFLGSMFGWIPAGFCAALFVLRTALEDSTLRNELPGYADYAAKVRWKLVPGIW